MKKSRYLYALAALAGLILTHWAAYSANDAPPADAPIEPAPPHISAPPETDTAPANRRRNRNDPSDESRGPFRLLSRPTTEAPRTSRVERLPPVSQVNVRITSARGAELQAEVDQDVRRQPEDRPFPRFRDFMRAVLTLNRAQR